MAGREYWPQSPLRSGFSWVLRGSPIQPKKCLIPQRTLLLGFGSAIITLVLLCVLIFISSIGVSGWESIVYKPDGSTSDSPLPMALAHITGSNHLLYHLLITIGLFGLVASFHGLILAAGRSSYEFGKIKFAPSFLGKIHPRFNTPSNALG